MSAFPPPLSQAPIFNPALFSSAVTSVISSAPPAPPTATYLEYPEAQGAESFTSGSNRTTIGSNNLAILKNVGVGDNGIIFGADGLIYNGFTGPLGITWANLATKIEAIQSLTQATNETTLNVNNSVSIQNGETTSLPTQTIVISADASGNRIALNGDYGTTGLVLSSGGNAGDLYWGSGSTPGSVGTLAEVLTNDNVANRDIDMADHSVLNINSLSISTAPVATPELDFTRTSIPIVVDGVTYFIGLFTAPP